MDERNKDPTGQKLFNYACFLLSRRDHTEGELKAKMKRWAKKKGLDIAVDTFETVLSRLKTLGYLNDEKFACQFLESRSSLRPRGKFLLRRELGEKGIDRMLFEKLWEAGNYSEEEMAKALLEQKPRLLSKLPKDKRKKKIISLLSSRGFSQETIYRVTRLAENY